MVTENVVEILLQQALGNPNAKFRDGQWEAIDGIVNKRQKLLVVQRTGWGKSAVYFLACKLLHQQNKGMTIIISPLLALIRNQIEAAQKFGLRAVSINSTNTEKWEEIEQLVLTNQIDCLFISPERLANEDFTTRVLRPISHNLGLMVIDEAHCISDWGHDFRPDYRRIVRILRQLPANTPVLCTTATANLRVIQDIESQIGQLHIQRGQLTRDNLFLQTLHLPNQASRLAWLATAIAKFKYSGIVYTLTTYDAERVAHWLQLNHIQAAAYHSDICHPDYPDKNLYREYLEDQLKENKLKVLVATTALGMGYDKPDLSFVIHYQVPSSVISYYQQVGRAGRGIENAVGILMSGKEDQQIQEYFRKNAFPNEETLYAILELLEQKNGLSENELQAEINLPKGKIQKALKFLSLEDPAPILKIDNKWKRTLSDYRLDKDRINYLTQQRENEWQQIQEYLHTEHCKMLFLREALDDNDPSVCGKCDSCLNKKIVEIPIDPVILQQATEYLQYSEEIIQPKKQAISSAFPIYKIARIPKEQQAEQGRVLSRWGDSIWGEKVRQGKFDGYFSDELVDAVAEMILDRWNPSPKPEWVCAVPSLNHPELVPSFAERLAQKLGLPFVNLFAKIRSTAPQKEQLNSFYQCKNLDGAFDIVQPVSNKPVLLVDDVIDSGWTLTVLATLLKRAGSGAVYPVALAKSSIKE